MTLLHRSNEANVAEAALRIGLIQGRDGVWRGRCPACGYSKPTLALKADCGERIALSCKACGSLAAIAACLDLPRHLVVPFRATRSTIAGALNAWERAATATGTPVEAYLRNRGIQLPVPPTIRYLRRQRNWSNGRDYAAMISLVQRSPGKSDPGVGTDLLATGAHFTFLEGGDGGDPVRKAAVDASKLSLGELRQGGIWLKPLAAIGAELTVAEGIETALSVAQITGLPTVAALSAAGMRSLWWPAQVRRLWIAADNDDVGLKAAEDLLRRALGEGLEGRIKIPAGGFNDFNDMVRGSRR